MLQAKQNSDFNELEDTELIYNAIKNAASRRDTSSDRYNNISELCTEESSLVIGGCCNDIVITCGMYCDQFNTPMFSLP
jgi:S-methylmethionine-dependent homocysteine/selenocysteine methylase